MLPGMNPRKMQSMMKRMGIQQVDIPASEVIIRSEDKELVFSNPQVAKVNAMGQETYQIIGEPVVRPIARDLELNEEDVKTLMEQTGVDKDRALELLKKHEGDIAAAILEVSDSS